uniref:Uncharacterized protein n=1 Tax=Pyrodinium bahamense TaxID=73915 RepID=A0A7S0FV76_9DINO
MERGVFNPTGSWDSPSQPQALKDSWLRASSTRLYSDGGGDLSACSANARLCFSGACCVSLDPFLAGLLCCRCHRIPFSHPTAREDPSNPRATQSLLPLPLHIFVQERRPHVAAIGAHAGFKSGEASVRAAKDFKRCCTDS